MTEKEQPDRLREILDKFYHDRIKLDDYEEEAWDTVAVEAEQSIRQYFAGKLPEKKYYGPDEASDWIAEGYNQALDDCRRAIEESE